MSRRNQSWIFKIYQYDLLIAEGKITSRHFEPKREAFIGRSKWLKKISSFSPIRITIEERGSGREFDLSLTVAHFKTQRSGLKGSLPKEISDQLGFLCEAQLVAGNFGRDYAATIFIRPFAQAVVA